MIYPETIDTLDLQFGENPAEFVITTMEEIDSELDGIVDDPHKHNYYTVIWPTKGGGVHIIDFKEYELSRDSLFFVSPGQVHQVITEPAPEGFVIMFTPCFLEKNSINGGFISDLKLFGKSDETPPLKLERAEVEILKPLVISMKDSFSEYISGNRKGLMLEKAGAYLKLFLIECSSLCRIEAGDNTQEIEVEKGMIRSFKLLLEDNFKKYHMVSEYASMLNVTPNYLNEVVSRAVKVSAKELITERIILEAKRMLLFSDKSSKEIGYSLGFDDPSHFSTFFKKGAGVTMQEFKMSLARNRNF